MEPFSSGGGVVIVADFPLKKLSVLICLISQKRVWQSM
jgi:hypothetical protein